LEKRLEHDKQVISADFAREIRNEFRKFHRNVRFKQVTRASSFAAEFNGQPAYMAQPDELPIQELDSNKIPYCGRKRASSWGSQSYDPPKAKKNKTANSGQICEGCKGSHILENCFLLSDPNNPQAGKARKKAFSYRFDSDLEFAAKVRKLRAEKGTQ
jgi:hypothetical protein